MLKSKKMGVFKLVMLSISAVVSLKSLPLFAEVGLSLIFFLLIAMLFFFIPISMVIAELSSTWPSDEGCYYWIKKAYGKSVGFVVMWAYWMESIIWFPTMLIFIIAMLSHALSPFFPNLENNYYFFIIGIILIFWILTYINCYGIEISSMLSSIGVIIGTIIPILLIILFGIIWVLNDNEINITFNVKSLIPDFNLNNLVFFSGILLGISGIEIISFHTHAIDNPKINIPKTVIISAIIIFLIYLLGSLSISIVVPKNEISLASGVIQALKVFFIKNNIFFIIPILSVLLLIGSISGMNTWIMGPIKGMFVTSNDGFLPKYFKITNNKNIPVRLLIFQAIVGSSLSIIFFIFINNINGLIWVFICLSAQFAVFMYSIIFLSIIKLRKKYPHIKRPYKVPFLNLFSWLGISMCIFTFFISYIQPANINIIDKKIYILLLSASFILLMLPSIIFILKKK